MEHPTTHSSEHAEAPAKGKSTPGGKPSAPPTMGELVAYHQQYTVHTPADYSPAIVQALNDDDTVRLWVFSPGEAGPVEGVSYGIDIGQWQALADVVAEQTKAREARLKAAQAATDAQAKAQKAEAEAAKHEKELALK